MQRTTVQLQVRIIVNIYILTTALSGGKYPDHPANYNAIPSRHTLTYSIKANNINFIYSKYNVIIILIMFHIDWLMVGKYR